MIIRVVYIVEESGLLQSIIKSIPSFSSVKAAMSDAEIPFLGKEGSLHFCGWVVYLKLSFPYHSQVTR